MKKVFLFLVLEAKSAMLIALLALVAAGGVFAQYNYVNGGEYKYYPGVQEEGYRPLRIETNDNWNDGTILHGGTVVFVKGRYAGHPNIVTIESVVEPSNWEPGDKTTIEEIMKDQKNVTAYSITTPNGYYVEFATYDSKDTESAWGRQFGIILQGSEVWFHNPQLLPPYISIESGAIAFDDEFAYASNLEGFMTLMARGVNYDEIRRLVNKTKDEFAKADPGSCPDFLLAKDNCKGDIYKHIIYNATQRGFFRGGTGGLAPPSMFPLDFIKVQERFSAQANLAAAIGYLSGWYPNGGEEFHRQLTIDNYILFAECDPNQIWKEVVSEWTETVITETVKLTAEILAKKVVTKAAIPLMIVSTAWDFGKGAWDEITPLREMGLRAIRYYGRGEAEFVLDPYTQTIVKYNGSATDVTIPDRIPDTINGTKVLGVAASAFRNNKTIESITLGSNIKTIEADAFSGCSSLKTVTFRKPVQTIGSSAFSRCGQLTTVNLPSNASATNMRIGDSAFYETRLTFPTKVALRKIGYTGAGVDKGITIKNNTGATVAVIERKNGSSWPGVLVESIKDGNSFAVDLAPGTYEIRIRTRMDYPDGDFYVKPRTEIPDGTTITFTANDKNTLTREECQAFIQARCSFNNPANVWKAIDTHAFADELYRTWARSYPNTYNRRLPYPKPTNKPDQELIQSLCKFSGPQAVWDVVNKHSDPEALLRVWANSYYMDTSSVSTPEPKDGNGGNFLDAIAKIIEMIFGDLFGDQVNTSLNGIWERSDGNVFVIIDNNGYFTVIDYNWERVQNNGDIKTGDGKFRNITSTGNLTWSAQELTHTTNTYRVSGWVNCTLTMTSDGNTFTSYSRDTDPPSQTYTRRL